MASPNPLFIFWQHDVNQTIPNNLWTPVLFNVNRVSRPRLRDWGWSGALGVGAPLTPFVAASTTIAVGSNGQALPQATINVADTSTFAPAGWLAVRISGTDRVVHYTGKTATTFTGCTLGVGTMTTGDQVRQGNVMFRPPFPSLTAAVAEVQFAANAVGQRGVRFSFNGLGLVGGTTLVNSAAAGGVQIQTAEQPAFELNSTPDLVEVWHNVGTSIDIVPSNLSAPRLVVTALGTYTSEPVAA